MTAELTEREQAMLAFTRTPWGSRGEQNEAIRRDFGTSPTRFWQEIRALITRPEALAYDPVTVHRLERLVGHRQTG